MKVTVALELAGHHIEKAFEEKSEEQASVEKAIEEKF